MKLIESHKKIHGKHAYDVIECDGNLYHRVYDPTGIRWHGVDGITDSLCNPTELEKIYLREAKLKRILK